MDESASEILDWETRLCSNLSAERTCQNRLPARQEATMKKTDTLSRRGFTKFLGAGAAYAAVRPSIVLPTISLRALAGPKKATGVVRLSSNENPYGPSPAALKAMTNGFDLVWRYPDEHQDELVEELARMNGVSGNHVLIGAGSGEILKLAAAAFTGPGKKIVVADPTFEAIGHHAEIARAEVTKIRLTADYSHDLTKMLAAANSAGLIYICNPNNPTASITPKAELRAFLGKVSAQTLVLVDEAYHHYVETSDYESVMPLAKDYPNLIVARTFSKIYGMAGLRCGYCVTQSANIQLMRRHQTFDSVNILAVVAALASLKDADHVADGRRSNTEVKQSVCSEVDKLGFRYIPSQANFMMIDLRREARPVIAALRERNVEVGRFFPPLPNFMRVTIGTKPQMEAFVAAFREVIA
jgi:histidinol-phosphate aminotransferase